MDSETLSSKERRPNLTRRPRVAKACLPCSRSKTKCDENRPCRVRLQVLWRTTVKADCKYIPSMVMQRCVRKGISAECIDGQTKAMKRRRELETNLLELYENGRYLPANGLATDVSLVDIVLASSEVRTKRNRLGTSLERSEGYPSQGVEIIARPLVPSAPTTHDNFPATQSTENFDLQFEHPVDLAQNFNSMRSHTRGQHESKEAPLITGSLAQHSSDVSLTSTTTAPVVQTPRSSSVQKSDFDVYEGYDSSHSSLLHSSLSRTDFANFASTESAHDIEKTDSDAYYWNVARVDDWEEKNFSLEPLLPHSPLPVDEAVPAIFSDSFSPFPAAIVNDQSQVDDEFTSSHQRLPDSKRM